MPVEKASGHSVKITGWNAKIVGITLTQHIDPAQVARLVVAQASCSVPDDAYEHGGLQMLIERHAG